MKPQSYLQTMPAVDFSEGRGDGDVSGTAALNHVEAAITYSPINHVGIQTQGYLSRRGWVYDTGFYLYQNSGDVHAQVLVGQGQGHIDQELKTCCGRLSSRRTYVNQEMGYKRVFFQPSIGYRLSDELTLGITFRRSFVKYQRYLQEETIRGSTSFTQGYSGTTYSSFSLDGLAIERDQLAASLTIHPESRFKVFGQIGVQPADWSLLSLNNSDLAEELLLNIGLTLDFGKFGEGGRPF